MNEEKGHNVSKVSSKGILGFIERMANKIPHPAQIFLGLLVIIFALSFALAKAGTAVTDPTSGDVVAVKNLIDSAYIAGFLQNLGTYFATFTPMLTVPLCTLGMALSTQTGFLNNGLRKMSSKAKSKWAMSIILAFIGVNANLVGDVAAYVYPALCAMLYYSIGRNPIAGFVLAMSSNGVGFGANVVVSAGDASLAGISKAAIDLLGGEYLNYETNAIMGWYFMFVSTFILTILLALVDIKVIEPSLTKAGIGTRRTVDVDLSELNLTEAETRGLRNGVIGMIAVVVVTALLCLPGLPLAAPEGKTILDGALTKCMATIIFFFFLVPGICYGKTVGKIKKFKDVMNMMVTEFKTLAPFYVVSFFAAIFIQAFNDSKIAYIIAVKAGDLISKSGLSGPMLLVILILIIALVNFFMVSASTKWNLLAPVFVPMLALNKITPAATQVAYRMGDGLTNGCTPINPSLIVNLAYAQKYDPDIQIGTLIVNCLKHTVLVGGAWIVFFYIWTSIGLPMGPGYAPFFLEADREGIILQRKLRCNILRF